MSGRTEEQKEADEALTAAVERTLLAYFGDDKDILMEYVVVAAHAGHDGERNHYSFTTIYRDNDVPANRSLGLLRMAAARIESS